MDKGGFKVYAKRNLGCSLLLSSMVFTQRFLSGGVWVKGSFFTLTLNGCIDVPGLHRICLWVLPGCKGVHIDIEWVRPGSRVYPLTLSGCIEEPGLQQ